MIAHRSLITTRFLYSCCCSYEPCCSNNINRLHLITRRTVKAKYPILAKGSDPEDKSKKRILKAAKSKDVAPKSPKEPESKGSKIDAQANVFVSHNRAIFEYCLSLEDLKKLPNVKKRSPYLGEPPIIMFLQTDLQTAAHNKFGGPEGLERQRKQIEAILKIQPGALSASDDVETKKEKEAKKKAAEHGLISGSGKVVLLAIATNGSLFVAKSIACYLTGSHSMFAEAVHSFADTFNQIILAYGIQQSIRRPDPEHPYGYSNWRYVSSLMSGMGIFCFGTGLSIYHGLHGLFIPIPLEPLTWAFGVLAVSFIAEGGTLVVAIREALKKAKAANLSIRDYIASADEPTLNVVLLEDAAAVFGLSIASASLLLSQYLQSPIPDAIGSIAIGSLLGFCAFYILKSNSSHLIGRSIPAQEQKEIEALLLADPMIRSVHDIKATELGDSESRFKAEIDFDGRSITRAHLAEQDMKLLLKEVSKFENTAQLESFMTFHGEQVIDRLGVEVDRIESTLKKRYPDMRHVDIEPL